MTINSKELSHPKYRADIDGLRAIAVLSVVGFHAFPNWIKGGFIGVDIFFVISGFLISTIIFNNLTSNSFSFIEFYSRRIKRIFPSLLLVLIACITVGWFTLLADEYTQLGKHIAGGTGFISNFLFWQESGYFDKAAETKPLLHLWSLGIEEQYYIVWPLLLWLAWKIRFNFLIITISAFIISFALNIIEIHEDAVADFYSPQTRFWELLTGSMLAYLMIYKPTLLTNIKNNFNSLQSILGVLFIATGIFLITKDKYFPGWWAILPTFGTVLIISAGTQTWLNRVILSNKLLVWFGLISFPLYLWHWPLLSFARILEGEIPRELRITIVFVSILLAWLTYQFVERPIRLKIKSKKIILLLLGLMIAVGFSGYSLYLNGGLQGYGYRSQEKSDFANYFENSLPKQHYFEAAEMLKKYRADCDFYDLEKHRMGKTTKIPLAQIDKNCYTPNPDLKKRNIVFIWGDSHAQQLYFGLNNNLPKDWQILIVASSGCQASFEIEEDTTKDYCQKSNQFALETIKEIKPNVVIIAQAHGHKFDELNKLNKLLLSNGIKKIIFTGPSPHWVDDLPKIIMRKLWNNTPERTLIGIDEKIMLENENLKTQFSNTKNSIFIDLIALFCNEKGCLTRIGDDKKTGITSWDYGHLTPIASDYLAKNLLVKIVITE